jgi:hypothetical protein
MEKKVITADSASELNKKIQTYSEEGWQVTGSHKVVEIHRQNRFRGSELVDTIIKSEYSITIMKNTKIMEKTKKEHLGETCCPKCDKWFDFEVVLKEVGNKQYTRLLKDDSYKCPNCKEPYELDYDCDNSLDAILLPIFPYYVKL